MSTGGGGAIGGGVPCMISSVGGCCGGDMGGEGYGQYRMGGYGAPMAGGGWWPISGGGPVNGEKLVVGGGNGGDVISGPPVCQRTKSRLVGSRPVNWGGARRRAR